MFFLYFPVFTSISGIFDILNFLYFAPCIFCFFLSFSPCLKRYQKISMKFGKCIISCILQVDSALQSMMNENSMDYVAKFADLAAQIASNGPEPQVKGRELATQ